MKILIVEDHEGTLDYLCKGLEAYLFAVDVAKNGIDGLCLALQNSYDLMIFDVMLPGIDGWQLIQKVRSQGIQCPILFLTARDNVEDRVRGLELGADDYLIKPYAFTELLARIRTLLRRTQAVEAKSSIEVADLIIYPRQYRAVRGQQTLNLTAKEFALLLLFASHLDEPLSRTYIAERVWDIHFETNTNVIDVAVKRLRSKLDKPFSEPLIHTARGIGYVMAVNYV